MLNIKYIPMWHNPFLQLISISSIILSILFLLLNISNSTFIKVEFVIAIVGVLVCFLWRIQVHGDENKITIINSLGPFKFYKEHTNPKIDTYRKNKYLELVVDNKTTLVILPEFKLNIALIVGGLRVNSLK